MNLRAFPGRSPDFIGTWKVNSANPAFASLTSILDSAIIIYNYKKAFPLRPWGLNC
jgi:hypothetical protein